MSAVSARRVSEKWLRVGGTEKESTTEATEKYSDGSCYFYVEWDLNIVGKFTI